MKKASQSFKKVIPHRQFRQYRYPNAAEPGYHLQKAVDWALAAAISLGTVTTLFFMFTLG